MADERFDQDFITIWCSPVHSAELVCDNRSMKFCGRKREDGSKCGVPHTENGAYCPECRREYQRNYRKGITVKGEPLEPGPSCIFCEREMRTNAFAFVGATYCKTCKGVLDYLKALRPARLQAMVAACKPQVFEVSDEDLMAMLENQ